MPNAARKGCRSSLAILSLFRPAPDTIRRLQPVREELNILVIAYVYPPDAGSGTYRTLYFANHWARSGDRVTVVTVNQECFLDGELEDQKLCREIDSSIRVVRAHAFRPLRGLLAIRNSFRGILPREVGRVSDDKLSIEEGRARWDRARRSTLDTLVSLLRCPDEHIGWIPDAVRQAYRVRKARNFDCIYALGGPWSAFLAARRVHRLLRIPLVLDFRDPWASNPNLGSKTAWCRQREAEMESRCVRDASLVVANTEELRQDFVRRYPDIGQERFITVTNGLEDIPCVTPKTALRFNLVSRGFDVSIAKPAELPACGIEILSDGAIPAKELRVKFVGGILSNARDEAEVRSPLLREVLEVTPRLGHSDALEEQRQASVLVLIQTGFPLQVPRKLYEYLSIGRAILAIADRGGATDRMVRELGAGYVVGDDVVAIKAAILQLYCDWKEGVLASPDRQKLRGYENRHLAGRLRDAIRALSVATSFTRLAIAHPVVVVGLWHSAQYWAALDW